MTPIIIGIIATIFIHSLNNKANAEEKHYTVIKKIDDIEIREYKKLIYASYTPKDKQDKNNSFRKVAGYIFGGNNTSENIAMTSPVVIKLHNKNEKAFIMPIQYAINELPSPDNKEILLYEEPAQVKASIQYSGYTNSRIEQKKIAQLKKVLKKNNIKHNNDFEVLVYNSPYKFINRKNEIVVSIEITTTKKK